MHMHARTTLLLLPLLPLGLRAQCGPYVGHPIAPATTGHAFVNLIECGASSCVWDNGSTQDIATGLSVGAHTVTLYSGATPITTMPFTVEQLTWDLGQQVLPYAGLVQVSIWAELPYCGTSIFDFHDCPPEASSTWAYLLQDGIRIDSINPVACPITQHQWPDLPFGHVYHTELHDLGACGSAAQGEPITAYDLSGAQFTLQVQGSSGADGSITVQDITPDALDPFSPPGPLQGSYLLLTYPDEEYVQGPQASTAFTGLAPGDYIIYFLPDMGVVCSTASTVVTVPLITGIAEPAGRAALHLWPQPAQELLNWTATAPQLIEVRDAAGRVVLQERGLPPLHVGTLPPGSYTLRLSDGRQGRFVVGR